MSINKVETVTWSCDASGCSESTESPSDWLMLSAVNPSDEVFEASYNGKHFHNISCLTAFLAE